MIKRSLPRSPEALPGEIARVHASKIVVFQREIAGFYKENKRSFPWREHITPYRIVISEIMLQQTGVERVIGKFEPFLDRFPGFAALAGARLSDVMGAWQGLGYNKRALSLKQLAGIVAGEYSGILPPDRRSLKALPGIGDATAGAIRAFAFDLPSVFIETNIRRVFIHHFFPDRGRVSDNEIAPLVEAALDWSHPRDWYYALMDYGTYLNTISVNPNRKSAHYSRQSRFQDSDRHIRGCVIKYLLRKTSASANDLFEATGCTGDRLTPILSSLIKDGLITSDAGWYRIT